MIGRQNCRWMYRRIFMSSIKILLKTHFSCQEFWQSVQLESFTTKTPQPLPKLTSFPQIVSFMEQNFTLIDKEKWSKPKTLRIQKVYLKLQLAYQDFTHFLRAPRLQIEDSSGRTAREKKHKLLDWKTHLNH